jgi:hypothetical protein
LHLLTNDGHRGGRGRADQPGTPNKKNITSLRQDLSRKSNLKLSMHSIDIKHFDNNRKSFTEGIKEVSFGGSPMLKGFETLHLNPKVPVQM